MLSMLRLRRVLHLRRVVIRPNVRIRINERLVDTRRPVIFLMLESLDASQSDESHQRLVCSRVDKAEPDGRHQERDHKHASGDGLLEDELTGCRELEYNESDYDAVADHDPFATCRVLPVVHSVQQLVLVDEMS